jgi:hypothetical protein
MVYCDGSRLASDLSLTELHNFAELLGIGERFFFNTPYPHYQVGEVPGIRITCTPEKLDEKCFVFGDVLFTVAIRIIEQDVPFEDGIHEIITTAKVECDDNPGNNGWVGNSTTYTDLTSTNIPKLVNELKRMSVISTVRTVFDNITSK